MITHKRISIFLLAAVFLAAVFFLPAMAEGSGRDTDPPTGRIQISQVAGYNNPYTGQPAGTLLAGGVYEIYSSQGELVEILTTIANEGVASIPLPLGTYLCREVAAPDFYRLDHREFQATLAEPDSLVKFQVASGVAELSPVLEVEGNREVLAGDAMRYDFPVITGVPASLKNCFWRVDLPASLRLQTIHTGTWAADAPYTVMVKTNLNEEYRTLASDLSPTESHVLNCGDLWKQQEEYITGVAFFFGKTGPDFGASQPPSLVVSTLPSLGGGTTITLWSDTGGWAGARWITGESTWTTAVLRGSGSELPKTGSRS